MGEKGQKCENIRELALDALLLIEQQEQYSHVVISGMLKKYDYLEGRDKAFFKRLVSGTLERQIELDYVIDSFSSTPTGKMRPLIRVLLRMSAYQILFMEGAADSAAVNEAVKLAQRRKFVSLKGFVNGVLRSIVRNKDKIHYPDAKKDKDNYLSVRYSMPRWLIEKWNRELGTEKTEAVLEGLLQERPVTIRLRSGLPKEEKEKVLKELTASGIAVQESGILPYAFYLSGTEGLLHLPAFRAGKFTVQDVSSMLAVEAAGIQGEDFVMDTCAAPGGKMLFAAEKAFKGSVLARDVSEAKLLLMQENKERMHAKQVTLQLFDATKEDPAYYEKADVVLADVPCSGLGVIGRKPDIKYRATIEGLLELQKLQKQILEAVWHYVKPSGVLLYSTCTISRGENEEMAEWFLKEHPFHAESLDGFLPEKFSDDGTAKGQLQFLPGIHGTDGFFIARFIRNQE